MLARAEPPSLLPIDWVAMEAEAARLLSRYIQFDTTNPPGNEASAVEFLADTCRERGFEPQIMESAPDRANLLVRLSGREGGSAPCLLYAHADVVPADASHWSAPPFAGQVKDGFVWGRGALDDKGLGIIFLQALSLLKEAAVPLKRDIMLLIAADEEACGRHGVAWLLDHYPELIRAGFVWDEGGMGLPQPGNPTRNLYAVAIAEKGSLTVKLTASGIPGHASIPRPDSAPDRLVQALVRVKKWQRSIRLTGAVLEMLRTLANSQPFPYSILFAHADKAPVWPLLRSRLELDPLLSPLIGNTVSLTMLRAGQKSNILPARAEAILDLRLLPGEDPAVVIAELRSLIGDLNVTVEIEETPTPAAPTSTDTDFYRALVATLQQLDQSGLVTPYLTPGTTDSRFFRQAGMQAYGFMPMLLNTQELSRIHGVDERVSTANLRWGIQVVFETLRRL